MTAPSPPIRYTIQLADPSAHLFEVTLTIVAPDPQGQRLQMPAWIPGSYMIREFAKNIVQLWASCKGEPVVFRKLDKQTWQCAPCADALEIRYHVYAWDLSVRTAHADMTHAYFNGSSVFLQVVGQEWQPCEIEVRAPVGERYRAWRVATSLERDGAPEYGFGFYRAANYDELIDCPVEMGEFTLLRFDACGVPHEVAITGAYHADDARLCRDLKAICEAQIEFFGGTAPMSRYVFLVMAVGTGYGGLEHRNSCSLICSRDDLPILGQDTTNEAYRNFLGLCSHEYFHTWWVKRVKPAAFQPYQLASETYTELLWVFEGVTSYYDELFLRRCGLLNDKEFIEMLGRGLTRVTRGDGRLKQSIAESSFDAWTKFYKQDENAANAIVSYYTKGAWVALALDLVLRIRTQGEFSLDHIVRAAWQRFVTTGEGMAEAGFEQLVREITNLDFTEFFDHAVRGTGDVDLTPLLREFAIIYRLRAPVGQDDKGGKPASDNAGKRPDLSARVARADGGAKVQIIYDNGTAALAGLAAEDVLIAVNQFRVSSDNVAKTLARYSVGDTVTFHVFRRDELMQFSGELKPAPENTVYLVLEEGDEQQRTRRERWLTGSVA